MKKVAATMRQKWIETPDIYLWSEQRSPRLFPFELPSQGNSPWQNERSDTNSPKKESSPKVIANYYAPYMRRAGDERRNLRAKRLVVSCRGGVGGKKKMRQNAEKWAKNA